MYGVVGFSRGEGWFVGRWGWRMLMESAIATASRPEEQEETGIETLSLGRRLFFDDSAGICAPEHLSAANIYKMQHRLDLARFLRGSAREARPGIRRATFGGTSGWVGRPG